MDIVAVALFFTLNAWFVIRAWKAHGWLSGRDRWSLITSFTVALMTFVVAQLAINWVMVPMLIWLIAVALLSGGVIGAALRWPELAWFSDTRPIRGAIRVGTTLVICALIIGVAVI